MGKPTVKSSSANKSAANKPATASKKPDDTPDSEEKSEFVEVVAETGDHVEPPPPEAIEPDPQMSPEEAEQVRKDYLLTRFWISARGYWGRSGDKLAWLFTIGLLALIVANVGFQYGINVWNRAIFDAIEKLRAFPRLCIISPRCSFRSRSVACCSASRRYSAAWASSAVGAPG
jgi:putative ATP-binding cassette transporter